MDQGKEIHQEFETVIGLEVHVQLKTQTKIFSNAPTLFGKTPNSQVTPLCLGMPGTLPVLNEKVVEFAIKMGLATHCEIAPRSIFARKNYFYPDLPKGYQISQYELPLCQKGWIEIEKEGKTKRIGITRIHMEEDAGKLTHVNPEHSLVDLNRAGMPLLEIVSEPELESPEEAGNYLRNIRSIVRYLEISDGNMEEGSLRCDANISIRPRGQKKLGTKVELKNLNSFRFVEKALEFERNRQIELFQEGKKDQIIQETRLYDSDQNNTRSMRTKEYAHDYRYFPDPDLLPLDVSKSWIKKIEASFPELAQDKMVRFKKEYKLSDYDNKFITQDHQIANFFEETLKELLKTYGKKDIEKKAKFVCNWIMGEFIRLLNERKIELSDSKISAKHFAQLLKLIHDNRINAHVGKSVLQKMQDLNLSAEEIVQKDGLEQISDQSTIENVIQEIFKKNPDQVQKYQGGKTKLLGFFVGQVMNKMKGKANPQIVNDLLKKLLNQKS